LTCEGEQPQIVVWKYTRMEKWTKDAKPHKDINITYLFTLFSSITAISF
jgi:hypothetical protein